jgi:beta-galactosidase
MESCKICFALLLTIVSFIALHPCAAAAADSTAIERPLSTKDASSITQGWGSTTDNRSVVGRPLSVAGAEYATGIGTHARGEMVFPVGGKHHHFSARVGVDDGGVGGGTVVFQVLLDGRLAFDSGVIKRGEALKRIDLDLAGVKEMRLVVTDAGDGNQNDFADWIEPTIDDVTSAKPVPVFSTAGFYALPNSPRAVVNFNPGWRFFKGDLAGAEAPEFDDAKWEAADLPHGLEILPENASGGVNYQGPAWYRKRFATPANTAGNELYIYFEAVMGKAKVWVNGQQVAEHFGGYLPFVAEIAKLLRTDGTLNVIAVRADNSNDPHYPPGKPQYDLDFAYFGGIYRDVYLISTGPVHVTLTALSKTEAGGGVFVGVKKIAGNDASLDVRTEVANDTEQTRVLKLRSTVESAEGQSLVSAEQMVTLTPGSTQEIVQPLEVTNAHFWFPNDPYQHNVRSELVDAYGKIVDSFDTRFGIRLFEMRVKDGLFINGKYVGEKLSGVNRHQDYAYVGNALPNSGQWRDVLLLRQGGCNVVRAAHYPMDPAFLDACDALGMLVTTANPGWQFYNDQDPKFEERIFDDTRNLVRRDRNRPSVLLWETALNETDNQPPSLNRKMHEIAHAEHPFPGFFTVTDIDKAAAAGMDVYYHGSSTTHNSFTREYGDGGEVDNFYSQNATTRVRRDWGEEAMLGQARIRAHDLDSIYSTPPIRLGAALWCGIDHQRGYHPDPFLGGLLDEFRVPRYAYYLFKSQYAPDFKLAGIETGPMVHIVNELTQISPADVVVYSNCEQVRLTWLGNVIGTQKPDAEYPHLPHPPFTFRNVFNFATINTHWRQRTGEIQMVAEGLIDGKVAATEVKKYPERVTGLRVTVDDDGIGLTADGSDFVRIRADVVDNKGVPKVLSTADVSFEVQGPGEIIGGESNHANPMRSEFGTAIALLRSTYKPGVIKVKASARGLASGEATVTSAPPALPLVFDQGYAESSVRSTAGSQVAAGFMPGAGDVSDDVKMLQDEVHRLRLDLTSKEQDIQELRGQKK